MVRVDGFKPEDLDAFQLQPQQLKEAGPADWRRMIEQSAERGPSWTIWLGQLPIMCAGIALAWRGRATCWSIVADGVPRSAWLGIHRASVERIEAVERELGIWRLEAETCFGFTAGDRWLAMLGFEREGLARGYGPGGQDFTRFARVTLIEQRT